MRFQNGQVFDLAILKPGFELARPFQNQVRFQNGQVNNLAVLKRPGTILLTILPIFLSLLFTSVCIDKISLNSFIIPRQLICLTMGGSLADKMSIVQPLL